MSLDTQAVIGEARVFHRIAGGKMIRMLSTHCSFEVCEFVRLSPNLSTLIHAVRLLLTASLATPLPK
jgi:hypothetical protein